MGRRLGTRGWGDRAREGMGAAGREGWGWREGTACGGADGGRARPGRGETAARGGRGRPAEARGEQAAEARGLPARPPPPAGLCPLARAESGRRRSPGQGSQAGSWEGPRPRRKPALEAENR